MHGKRSVKFEAMVDKKWLSCRMENVSYIPTAHRNLFSVTSALDRDMSFNSSKNDVNSQGMALSKHEAFELVNYSK
jgi:hypothetical protein